jgi:benzoylformate decarboxylase
VLRVPARAIAEPGAETGVGDAQAPRTVRDAAFDVLRDRGLTTIFGNPGFTEIPLLAGLPEDLRFVLALHEGSVVGLATGWAIGRGEPALSVLHTTAGLGNAVGALATARVNRAPLVVLVGQQDRRHLPLEPFLAGRLRGLAGEYPVFFDEPARPQGVPGAIARAWHEAATARGPALVVVPRDDWLAPAPAPHEPLGPSRLIRAEGVDRAAVTELAAWIDESAHPVLVVGAGADDAASWTALTALGERLGSPVWQEPFGARAGFPQDHSLFAGHLPADRSGLRESLEGHDLVLVVGAPVFREYTYEPGPLVPEGARVALVTDEPAEAHRSPADLALLGPIPAVCEGAPKTTAAARPRRRAVPAPCGAGHARSAGAGRAAASRARPRGARGAARRTPCWSRRPLPTAPSCRPASRRAARSAS